MYKYRPTSKTMLRSVEKVEGEMIEQKIERILDNKEPIKDGAPEIFTERKEGVLSAYNIRTDRWEIASSGMDIVQKSIQAKREEKAKTKETETKEGKVIDIAKKETGGQSESGTK